jgi:hypothetical protein
LQVDVASLIATGRTAAHMEWDVNEEENAKRLVGVLLQGDLFLCIDNVDKPVSSALLCSIVTQGSVQVRILSVTGQITLPANLCVAITGNHLVVRGDLGRRSIREDMDAKHEAPELREFDVDLYKWVPEHRGELVAAALTILRAFVVASDHDEVVAKLPRYGSFELWSERVRAVLVWLDQPDPCETTAAVKQDDDAQAAFAGLIAAWVEAMGTATYDLQTGFKEEHWLSLGQVTTAANMDGNVGLDEALKGAMAAKSNRWAKPREVTAASLGAFLTDYIDRVVRIPESNQPNAKVNSYRIRKRVHPRTRSAQYLVERMIDEMRGGASPSLTLQKNQTSSFDRGAA